MKIITKIPLVMTIVINKITMVLKLYKRMTIMIINSYWQINKNNNDNNKS